METLLEETTDILLETKLKGMTVHDLRTYARLNTSLPGTAIISLSKADLIASILAGKLVNGNGNGHAAAAAAAAGSGSSDLADIIAHAIQGKITAGIDEDRVKDICFDIFDSYKNDIGAFIETKLQDIKPGMSQIEIKAIDGNIKNVGYQHKDFPALVKLAANRLDAMLVGPAGSGKTTACHAIATALNLTFYAQSVGAQTTKTDLIGYMDAAGNYVETVLYKAYKSGGLYLLDEIDAGNPNVITMLNALLANSGFFFPNGEYVTRHPDFICFAAGNTFGRGNDRQYIGRNQLDAASLDRFISWSFDYDEILETYLATGHAAGTQQTYTFNSADVTDNDLLNFVKKVQAIRTAAGELKEKIVVSPRASIKGCQLLRAGFFENDVLEMVIFKGINAEVKNKIMNRIEAN